MLFRRKAKAGVKPKKAARKKGAKRAKAKVKKVKKAARKAPKALKSGEVLMGRVSHYFPHVKAGAILIKKGTIALGDTLHIKGHTTDLKQKVTSLQIDRAPVEKAGKGDEIGLLVKKRVRINDKVYKVKI